MLAYFSLTLFVSATLLFLVQPMIGKMILPQLGGTPAVWNTCMVFFQGVLLVGYGYTHLLTTTQSTRRQVMIQGCLLFLPFLVLPFSLGDWAPPTEENPVLSLLYKLVIMVGLPFLMVSTTAPLLQKWFFHTGHPAAQDPYFLYGASNFGSMLGLIIYPTIVEPWLQVAAPLGDATWQTQVHLWTFGYALFVGLVVGCAVIVWQALAGQSASPAEIAAVQPPPPPAPKPTAAAATATAITPAAKRRAARTGTPATAPVAPPPPRTIGLNPPKDDITLWRRLRWIGLAAAPSSLMLGVTTYMTTDIAAIAFFWIIPLALYLLTFILVFSRWPTVWTEGPHTIVMFVQPCLLLFLVLKMIASLAPPTWAEFLLHLGAFFSTTLMCHGELAKDRPSTKYLTEFYFWMSLGGVLGGLFNALISPIVFQHGIWEYPVAMACACLLRSNLVEDIKTLIPNDSTPARPTWVGYALDLAVPIVIGFACYFLSYAGDSYSPKFFLLKKSYLLAVLVVIVLALSLRPVRFGLSIATLFIAMTTYDMVTKPYIYEGRGFFGYLRVEQTTEGPSAWERMPPLHEHHETPYEWKVYRKLIHGGINHGQQIVRYRYADEHDNEGPETEQLNLLKRRVPITYFHERNGVAEVFYKLSWPKAQPLSAVADMTGKSDARMPASMVGLASGEFAAWTMLANTHSEPPYAVVGLGTGILACYAKPYQQVDFFEIDPLVRNLSMVDGYFPPWHESRPTMPKLPDPTFFFLHDAQERWAKISVKLGDGRLKIKESPAQYYHVIVLDAFSSDAIPIHLLTKEAVLLYLEKLAEGGILVFNTTNRYVRIEGVLSSIARDLDLDCLYCADYTYAADHPDRFSADWVVMQRKIDKDTYRNGGLPIRDRLEPFRKRLAWNGTVIRKSSGEEYVDERWQPVPPLPGPAWTDSYSNMLNPRVMPWLTSWQK